MTKEFYYQNLAYDYEGQALLLRYKAIIFVKRMPIRGRTITVLRKVYKNV